MSIVQLSPTTTSYGAQQKTVPTERRRAGQTVMISPRVVNVSVTATTVHPKATKRFILCATWVDIALLSFAYLQQS